MPADEKTLDRLASSEEVEDEAQAAQFSRKWNLRMTEGKVRIKWDMRKGDSRRVSSR